VDDGCYQIVVCEYCRQKNRLMVEGRQNYCGRCGHPFTRLLPHTDTCRSRADRANAWWTTLIVVVLLFLLLRGWSDSRQSRRFDRTSYPTATQVQPWVAENASYYGQISEQTGRPKTVYIGGYYREDGTYVREHFRSPPR
jgi:hypothetical protein